MKSVHILTLLLVLTYVTHAHAQEAPLNAEARKVLDRFIGEWNAEVMNKPAKSSPDRTKRSVKQSISPFLKGRFILGREVNDDGMKILWLMTHDPKANTYPFWYFNNKGMLGGVWENTWDEASKTLTGKAVGTPKGWSSHGTNHFLDKNTSHVAVWMKDETGTFLFDSTAKKARQPADAKEKTLAEWSRHMPDEKLPPEQKVLERLVGTWEAKEVLKPAEWTPKELRTTSKIIRKWVLDGRLLQDTAADFDSSKGLSLFGYDPQMKAYRGWWFSSEGHTSKSTGRWDAAAETLSMKADLGNGLTSRGSVRFIDKDNHVWTVIVQDEGGKLYFHGEWTVTREK